MVHFIQLCCELPLHCSIMFLFFPTSDAPSDSPSSQPSLSPSDSPSSQPSLSPSNSPISQSSAGVWRLIGSNEKCDNNIDAHVVDNQAACQAEAVVDGAEWYSYQTVLKKCFVSQSCSTFSSGLPNPWYRYHYDTT